MRLIKLGRLAKSLVYAFKGLKKVTGEEQNFRLQLAVAIFVIMAAVSLKFSRVDSVLVLILITLVLVTEVLNSAVERMSDLLKPRIDIHVKEIKDIMAAAVVIVSLAAAVGGIIIFWPYLGR